ncbi:GntR family transcriptional regulator [Pseudomonas laurylsulfatiphila]
MSMNAGSASAAKGGSAIGITRAGRQRVLTMPEQIAESITLAILRGEYGPGDSVREQELADHFQVSRGPIREALRILEKVGVVTIVPQRGAHVTSLSRQEIDNLFEIRAVLAGLLAKYLADVDASVVNQMDAIVTRLELIAGQADALDEYAQGSYRLSTVLFQSCGNKQLAELMGALAIQTARYTRLGLRSPERRQASAVYWRGLVEALGQNNSSAAGNLMVELIDASHQAALNHLE